MTVPLPQAQRLTRPQRREVEAGVWRDTLTTAGISHKRTRPYRPQTNGKVERYNRTMLDEWA